MIVGATVGELPGIEKYLPEGIKLDMFFFVSITTVIMAWSKIFPPQKYTKYISWDILITIACAFAISKAMENSGVADLLAGYIISLSHDYWPLCIAGRIVYHYEYLYGADNQQCSGGTGFPYSLVPVHPVRCQPDAFLRGHLHGSLSQFLHPYRLSDQPDCTRYRKLQVHRLRPYRIAAEHHHVPDFRFPHPADMAVLKQI